MRLSKNFFPFLKEVPSSVKVISHALMMRSGMIYQTASGIYSWLPIGVKVLKKIENIIREEQNKLAQEVILPTIQPYDLWQESGRHLSYGKEMLKFSDRHNRDMVYGPTAEEVMTDLLKSYCNSYKDLPRILYQINWKFRDEMRPRFGVMRGREFLMKDAYSFDLSFNDAKNTYYKMYKSYFNILTSMGLSPISTRADSGPIGGDLSHEFHVLTKNGESDIIYDTRLCDLNLKSGLDTNKLLNTGYLSSQYSQDDSSIIPEEFLASSKGIEVGHIFHLGTQYTKSMNLRVTGSDGNFIYPYMGCFGLGISRLVAAIIESHFDDKGIIWPENIAPFKLGIINLRMDDKLTAKVAEDIYNSCKKNDIEVIYDDSNASPGIKLSTMDLIGVPWQIILNPKRSKKGVVNLKKRSSSEEIEVSIETALSNFI